MGSYVQSALTTGEHVTYEGRISLWHFLPYILWGLVLLPLYGLGLLFWLYVYLRYISAELAITNKRIVAKFGFIQRVAIEISLQKTESIHVNQGVFGRIFNFGSIMVSGGGMAQAPIPGISNPMQFRMAFLAAQELATAKSN